MSDVVIRCEGLGKSYIIGHQGQRERYTALRDVLASQARHVWRRTREAFRNGAVVSGSEAEEFWALKDVSFEVNRGEVVGIIGRNGAGKSTLLKILSRITEPSEGRVTLGGRVASLLEVGTGFHPELTGRENIFLNGAILGMTRAEIKRKFDEIVAFAEVEKFLDTPVKRYSSGMYVRLAFSVAAHLEPEILVIDEVLAVGDAEFQRKCLGKMQEVSRGGRTVLFVSHNMAAIKTLCPRALLMAAGRLKSDGNGEQQIDAYLTTRSVYGNINRLPLAIGNNLVLTLLNFATNGPDSNCGRHVQISFEVRGRERIRELAILLYSKTGLRLGVLDLRGYGIEDRTLEEGSLTINLELSSVPLIEGSYNVGVFIVTNEFSGNLLDVTQIDISSTRAASNVAPYPSSVLGFADMQSFLREVSISGPNQAIRNRYARQDSRIMPIPD